MLQINKSKPANRIAFQAVATSFLWSSVDVLICAPVLHIHIYIYKKIYIHLKCVNTRLTSSLFFNFYFFKQKPHCMCLGRKKDDSSDAPLFF